MLEQKTTLYEGEALSTFVYPVLCSEFALTIVVKNFSNLHLCQALCYVFQVISIQTNILQNSYYQVPFQMKELNPGEVKQLAQTPATSWEDLG